MEFSNKNLQGGKIAKTTIICSMGRIEHINTYFFMMKCEIKIFSLEFMPSLGNGAAICPLQKSMKSKY